MHQALDPESSFSPVNEEFTPDCSRREAAAADGIDDILTWLGLQSSNPEFYGGGGGRRGDKDYCSGWTEAPEGLGQLMEMDNDESDYFDYSCFSSGLISPNLESEFPGMTTCKATTQDAAQYPYVGLHSSYGLPGNMLANLPDRPPSPVSQFDPDYHLHGSVTYGRDQYGPSSCDDYFPMVNVDRRYGSQYNSEEQVKVREIARQLASFEVQPWSATTPIEQMNHFYVTPESNPGSPVMNRKLTSRGTTITKHYDTKPQMMEFKRPLVMNVGCDDSNCGIVNPNDVFRCEQRTDHMYAITTCQNNRQNNNRYQNNKKRIQKNNARFSSCSSSSSSSSTSSSPSSSLSSSSRGRGSVLEAFLRSTEIIDPNKGSGAVFKEGEEEEEDGQNQSLGVADRKTPERMLKRLLAVQMNEKDLVKCQQSVINGHKSTDSWTMVSQAHAGNAAATPDAVRYFENRQSNNTGDMEMSIELAEIMKEQSRQDDLWLQHYSSGMAASTTTKV